MPDDPAHCPFRWTCTNSDSSLYRDDSIHCRWYDRKDDKLPSRTMSNLHDQCPDCGERFNYAMHKDFMRYLQATPEGEEGVFKKVRHRKRGRGGRNQREQEAEDDDSDYGGTGEGSQLVTVGSASDANVIVGNEVP